MSISDWLLLALAVVAVVEIWRERRGEEIERRFQVEQFLKACGRGK